MGYPAGEATPSAHSRILPRCIGGRSPVQVSPLIPVDDGVGIFLIESVDALSIEHIAPPFFQDLVANQISKTEGHGSAAKVPRNAKKLPEHNGSGSRTQY